MKNPIQISGADQILSIFIFEFGQNFGKFPHNHKKLYSIGANYGPRSGGRSKLDSQAGFGRRVNLVLDIDCALGRMFGAA